MDRYEYYSISDPALANLWGVFWQGQTFTPQEAHSIEKIKLRMFRHGAPGSVWVSVKATDASGFPTGADLCSGLIDGNGLPTDYTWKWAEASLDAAIGLADGTKYSVVARGSGGDQDNYVRWRYARPQTYPRGVHVFSADEGSNWQEDTESDLMFEEWGQP
jgi:hypothetical protein